MADKLDELKKVRELIGLMKENDLIEIEISDGDKKIHLKRPQQQAVQMVSSPLPAPAPAAPAAELQKPKTETARQEEAGLLEIKSPIVGTFYAAPNPDAPPYVNVGDKVKPDTVVCIVEAMKVMNEIKAETAGTIVEVLVKDGQSVEYGQPLFKVRP
ncbi:MAG TPA: acetyl-CoA carboxylase biotin carboxyl carrier protein [Anaerohalosphaeraceae bacterium]|jgi:acetyl-CoA carboxylase biotin carboxyl carrier protein|nr:acetyl-CoA carboxylase biotin carboxyl carrier protein [Anaerohalosphaeraceae bacterium]HQG06581.1 acetyl-CoA carboxylase biotin carboxyl carrier protein [Anaerohalosphaeraceae bacterium]HQI08025.1 acetyl-CoA carboxylase biotin carboxyl carrier protein [Anaerohalosphaeraceae bacterium]HQJ68326.1 acetyl-CoA carboxylase biotin carboxyl carrier protein [Anaerohalosphaeraceae bacterium]